VLIFSERVGWGLGGDDVSCFFPHDPSVPTDPYPIATLIVELLFEHPERTKEQRDEFAVGLADTFRSVLAEIRGVDPEQVAVEVAVKRFDPSTDGFCMLSAAKKEDDD
jgi:hypothetical protein